MKTIEDIHFYFEQLSDEHKKPFDSLIDPLYDNTDFLLQKPPKFLIDKYKKYQHLPLDDKNPYNMIAYVYQYAMSAAYLHKKWGKKVIRFQNSIVVKQLNDTDTFSLRTEDLNDPLFNNFFVDLGKESEVNGFFVFMNERTMNVMMINAGRGEENTLYSNHSLRLRDGETFAQVVDIAMEDSRRWAIETGTVFAEGAEEDARRQLNFVFSVLFYLQSAIADPDRIDEAPLPKRKAKKVCVSSKKEAIRQAKAYHTILIKTLPQEQREYSDGMSNKEHGMPLTLVRGHYRRQPIGPREFHQRKTIWIKPFWKGEEEIQNKMHIYKV